MQLSALKTIFKTFIFIIVFQLAVVSAGGRNGKMRMKQLRLNGGDMITGSDVEVVDNGSDSEEDLSKTVQLYDNRRKGHHSSVNHHAAHNLTNNLHYIHRNERPAIRKPSAFTPPLSSSFHLSETAHKIYRDILPMIRHFSSHNSNDIDVENVKTNLFLDDGGHQRKNASNTLNRVSRALPFINVQKRTAQDDHVSKNISMLLEHLLKNYESSQIPTHGQGVPTIVKTNILIRSMGPVSELDMEYSMDCYFRQYWRDKRLSFKGPFKSLSLSIKMLERIWRPDTYFYNGKHSHIHTITVPNKLLRLNQDGDILYSMRLTIKASCPMQLRNFPMDRQSCPLVIGSYGYTSSQVKYEWQNSQSVNFVPGMALSQFDVNSIPQGNYTYHRREGAFSVLQVSFNLQRHTGYFLIQVYVPCILIVVLSWVGFWIHREATSDRVGLGITTVLTLSTISLDSRTDLPKVRYATALDWFLLGCFFYCIATLLEFAGVHFFTKVGSGEIHLAEAAEWEDIEETEEIGTTLICPNKNGANDTPQKMLTKRRSSSMICPIYNDPAQMFRSTGSGLSTMERQTQTEPPRIPKWKQVWLCFLGDENFKKEREREVKSKAGRNRYVNSVSLIDRTARVVFPASFTLLNILYWLAFYTYQKDFSFEPLKGGRVKFT